ncbi:MAG: hypothetical protein WDZ77_01510 [Candidatus Pacearchaeota archaeon]
MKLIGPGIYRGSEGEETTIRTHPSRRYELFLRKESFSGDSFYMGIKFSPPFPLMVEMKEESSNSIFNDSYIFSEEGDCINHSYSTEDLISMEVKSSGRDNSIARLIVKGDLIKKLLDIGPASFNFSKHPIFNALRDNSI